MIKNLISLTIIFIVSLVLSLPLLKPGFYTVHDDQQFARLFEFDKSIKSGQIPPRWVQDLGFGFGYPLFVFYPPLVYFLGETFHLAGAGFIDSIKLVFFISIFGSGVAMYFLVKEFWGRLSGLVSGIFYILAPYRALDLYVRGALAESFSFVFLPLVLWSFYKLQKTNKSTYVVYSGFFLALLMITHNLIFLPFMLILPIFIIFLALTSPQKKTFVTKSFSALAVGAGLSAFFWLPALYEKKFTIVDQLLIVNLADFRIHFVYPQQLWNWPWGFGGSAAGLADGISFKIGKLHVIVAFAALTLALVQQLSSKIRSTKASAKFDIAYIFFALFVFSAFMTTFYSKFIWDLIPPLWYLQFPWRFLTFVSLATSILAGAFIYFLRLEILKITLGALLMIILIIPNLKLFNPQTYRETLDDKTATSKANINWEVSMSSFEYAPRGVELYKNPSGGNIIKIDRSQIPQEKAQVLEGAAKITTIVDIPSRLFLTINAGKESQIRANIFNFPGWQLKIDGRGQKINDDNNLKLITFDVPTGMHKVELAFKNTWDRNLANATTIATFISLVLMVALRNNRMNKLK